MKKFEINIFFNKQFTFLIIKFFINNYYIVYKIILAYYTKNIQLIEYSIYKYYLILTILIYKRLLEYLNIYKYTVYTIFREKFHFIY